MRKNILLAAAALSLTASPLSAQTTIGDRLGQILGNLLGVGNQAANSLEGQWTANKRPLGDQRAAFEARIDSDVTANLMTSTTAARLKSDYYALTQLEAQYGADGVFTTAERSDLTARYNGLLTVLTNHRYADTPVALKAEVADGQTAFNARVDAQLSKRKISRATAARLKSDYTALMATEKNYLADNVLTDAERSDLDTRADALDVRVGDVGYNVPAVVQTPQMRLDAIAKAVPLAKLTTAARAQLLVEHGDLTRLAQAYTQFTASADEKAYLERRLANLELRAKVVR